MTRQNRDYVDREKFTEAMDAWLASWKLAKAEGNPLPTPSNYIGQCIIDIADGVGNRHNYRRYSYLDEMKLDAIENAIRYLYNYDPEKGTPFTFISGNIEKVFKTRIGKEHRQTYYKIKSFQNLGGMSAFSGEEVEVMEQSVSSSVGTGVDYNDWIAEYEEKQSKKREKQRERQQERAQAKRDQTSIAKYMK